MDSNIFRILNYLSEVTIGIKRDISDILNEIFPFNENLDEYHKRIETGAINRFLKSLEGITSYSETMPYRRELPWGFIQFDIAIDKFGIETLNNEKDRLKQLEVHQSAIDVNSSIIAVNKAVEATDARMLEHAERQEAIMQTQSGFMQQQVGIMDDQRKLVITQNNIYIATMIISAVNILLTITLLIITTKSNSDKELISTQRSQILAQQTEIKQLKLLKSDTVHYVLHYPVLKGTEKKR